MNEEEFAYKKMKINEEMSPEFPMDPFVQFPYLGRLILQHTSGTDLLMMSQVSNCWNKLVTLHQNEHQKIRLVIKEEEGKEFKMDQVTKSNRKYTSIKIVSLKFGHPEVFSLLQHLAMNLVKIYTNYDFEMENVTLPRVEDLTMVAYHDWRFYENGLLGSVMNLKKLYLYGQAKNPSTVVQCLKANPALEELTLEHGAPKALFLHTDLCGIGLTLTTFKTDEADFGHFRGNIINFLIDQRSSLTQVKLLSCAASVLRQVFANKTNIRRLTYSPKGFVGYFNRLNLEVNGKLQHLELINVPHTMTMNVLQAAPNLETLYIATPTLESFKQCVFRAPKLQEFSYAVFEGGYNSLTVEDLRSYYLQICHQHELEGARRFLKIHQI